MTPRGDFGVLSLLALPGIEDFLNHFPQKEPVETEPQVESTQSPQKIRELKVSFSGFGASGVGGNPVV